MAQDISPNKDALEDQCGEGYLGRVYRTSLVVFAMVAALLYGRGGLSSLIGLAYGAAISLASLRAIELGVRWLVRLELKLNQRRMAALMVLKFPVLGVVLSGAAWLVVHNVANVFALVGGVALAPSVIFLKAVGALLVPALPESVPASWAAAGNWRARVSAAREYLKAAERSGAGGRRRYPAALPAPD